ncbi:hypothetical protein [Streptomyces sp. NPDC049040]|uniref:hypothetical protein n=1 Tax=Streptomyces sp. NPDC049040 TaxID=3365593 RepID=UPI00371FE5AD
MPPRSRRAAEAADRFDAEAAVDELYGVAPGDFVARRQELAAAARTAGDAAAVRQLKALRKPTLAAWAGNQFVRAHPAEAEQFARLGRDLRRAFEEVDQEAVRELTSQQWRLISAVARQVAEVAAGHGQALAEPVRRDVEQTLRAVAADQEAAQQWLSGRLDRALVPSLGLPAAAPAGRRKKKAASAPPRGDGRRDEAADREAEERRRRLLDAREALEEARGNLDTSKAAEQTAAGAEADAAAQEERAAASAQEAERDLREAREALDAAAGRHRQAVRETRAAARERKKAEKAAEGAAAAVARIEAG